jgi:hypothetical protein
MNAAMRQQARRVARLQRLMLLAVRREERQAREPVGRRPGP